MPKHSFGRTQRALHFNKSCIEVIKDLKDNRHPAVHNKNRKNIRVCVKNNLQPVMKIAIFDYGTEP